MNGTDTLNVISRMKQGASDAELASAYKVNIPDIQAIRKIASERELIPVRFRAKVPRLTHEERRERKKKIIAWLESDQSRTKEQAAEHFGLHIRTIEVFIRQKRGKPTPSKLSHKDAFRVATMFVLNKSNSDIGRELGVSREHVRQMRNSATEAGFFDSLKRFLEANTNR